MADNKINVGGRLHSIATGNVLGGANEIFDDSKNKKQSDINTETYSLVNDVNERLSGLSPDQQSALTVAAKATNNETKLGYYVCGTEGNLAAKVISDATGYILSKGGSMKVKMTNANTANNATLNINSTGAKPLYYDGERASANNSWEAGETVEVYYDGTSYYANSVAGGSGDGAFDISAKTGDTYETLSAALTAANSILSAGKKKGGMSIKFIQTTPAKYTVVKTEGATEQPTGTELQNDPGIISGTYTAGELSVFSTLPATLNASLTYYLAVTEIVDEQEVTTYTTWVITYAQSSDNKYVQYMLMNQSFTTNVTKWQGVDDIPIAGSNNLVKSSGVAEQFGIVVKTDIVGNNADWKIFDSHSVFIKKGSKVVIELTGPITFAGTSETQAFLSVYWKAVGSYDAHYIGSYKGSKGTIDNEVISFTATVNCYIGVEGRWHDTETLHLYAYTGLLEKIVELDGKQSSINRCSAKVIHCSQIDFNNTNRKVTIAGVFVADPSNKRRLTIPAAEVPYDFAITNSSAYCLAYRISQSSYHFITTGNNTEDDIVVACFEIANASPSYVKKVVWCPINNCQVNGVSFQTQIDDNKEAIQEANENITSMSRILQLGYNNLPLRNIVKGSMNNGRLDTSNNTCITATDYILVYPNTCIHVIHAADINIRITEFSISKAFIKQKGYDKFDYYFPGDTAKFIKISADYTERGYSNSNPVSVSDYVNGDFGIDIIDAKRIENIESQILQPIDNYKDKFYFVDGNIWSNGSNLYKVRVIPVTGGGTIFCKANPNIATRIAFLNSFDEDYVIDNLPVAVDGTGNQNTQPGQTRVYDIPQTCTYIALNSLYARIDSLPDSLIIDGTEYIYKKTISKRLGEVEELLGEVEEKSQTTEERVEILENYIQPGIIGRNIHQDASVRATGIKAVNTDYKPLSFIHISDIHTKSDNYKCFENACMFYEYYNNIKFMIVTGDIVWDTYHDPTTWYNKALAKTSKPVLNVVGNHDAGQYNATYGLGSQSSDLECYNKFIAPYVNAGTLPNGVTVPGWGVIQPTDAATEGKSYYYKDFADEAIRLIVLCEFETDYEINQEGTGLVYDREHRAMRQEQVTWLINTLTNTPSYYGVIVAYHQPDNLAEVDNEFVSFDLVGSYRTAHGNLANIAYVYCDDKEWLPKILNAFATKSSLTLTVTQTGAVVTSSPTLVCDCDFTNVQAEFICILNGHTHRDYIGHLTNFPALKVLCVGADNLKYTSGFQPRQEGTPSEDLFNVVNIDRNRKTIKIIRIGSDASVTGQVRDQMIMSYATT